VDLRKLVTIRRISSLEPIPNADNIELARVDGWQIVTQKGWAKPNMLVAFFEVDSFIPVDPRFEFLRKSGFKSTKHLGDGFRLKTIKLRKTLSQGLIMPLEDLFELDGLDITEILNVQKYEKPIPSSLAGKVKGNFPTYIRKSDQERAQNLGKELQQAIDDKLEFETTLKLDGSSMTVYCWEQKEAIQGEFGIETEFVGVCSRNWDLDEDKEHKDEKRNAFWDCANKRGLIEAIKVAKEISGYGLAFQGELVGPGVQYNRENLLDLDFYLYNIWNIDEQRYLSPFERQYLLSYLMERGHTINHVPVIDILSLDQFCTSTSLIDGLLKYADRPSLNPEVPAEGIVFKSMTTSFQFKIINNQFLLGEKD